MARRIGRKLACGAALFGSAGFGAVATAAPASAPEGPTIATPAPARAPVAVDLARLGAAIDAVRLVQATTPPPVPEPPVTEAVPEPAAPPAAAPVRTAAPAPCSRTAPAPPPPQLPPPPAAPTPTSSAEQAIAAWFPEVYDQAVAVARCESGMNPGAVSAGGGNHGLFQINNVHRSSFESVTGRPWSDVYDAGANAQFARYLYDRSGWDPWACQP